MIEETQIITREGKTAPNPESKAFTVSIRAWITIIMVLTVCYMSIMEIKIAEPLYTLSVVCIGYYYAQKERPQSQTGTVTTVKNS